MGQGRVDPLLYTREPKFGAAGGPDELRLTMHGRVRAFAVANSRMLDPEALAKLLQVAATGSLGMKIGGIAPSFLVALGWLAGMDGRYFVTDLGSEALARAAEEEAALLARIAMESPCPTAATEK